MAGLLYLDRGDGTGVKLGAVKFGQQTSDNSVPVVLPSDQTVPISVAGTVAVTQSGVWNITDISGTISLPTGAATAAKQLLDGHNVTIDNTSIEPIPVEFVPVARDLTPAVISFSSSGDNEVIAAVASEVIRVYAILFKMGGDADIIFKNGSTALTGTMPFVQYESMILDPTDEPWYVMSTNTAFNINLSAAVQVSGTVWYTQG